MSTNEDLFLPNSLEKLEIVPVSNTKNRNELLPITKNPFYNDLERMEFGRCNCQGEVYARPKRSAVLWPSYSMTTSKTIEHNIINKSKFKEKRIRKRKPLFGQSTDSNDISGSGSATFPTNYDSTSSLKAPGDDRTFGDVRNEHDLSYNIDFKSLIKECSNLTIQGDAKLPNRLKFTSCNEINRCADKKLRKIDEYTPIEDRRYNNIGSTYMNKSCSQQALVTPTGSNCDITIDELASYFDLLVHIPKKMSSMAEMMYI